MNDFLQSYLKNIILLQESQRPARKKIGFKYLCIEEFVLKNGKSFTTQPLPKNIEQGPKKDCYHNAAMLAIEHPELTYVEGYGIAPKVPFPVLHAWVINDQGKVIDNTWDNPENSIYFGVPFQRKFLFKTLLSSGYYGLLDNWKSGWPLLKRKWRKQ